MERSTSTTRANWLPTARPGRVASNDSSKLYIAFDAHDPDPRQIRASLQARDKGFNEDTVGVLIDPFNSLRFPSRSGVQTWGFAATRDNPRQQIDVVSRPARDSYVYFFVNARVF